MATMSGALGHPERDAPLLAFIDCHLTSIARWNIVRVLTESPEYGWTVSAMARAARATGEATWIALDEFAEEGLVRRRDGPDGRTYALEGTESTARVLARLLAGAQRDRELRQVIVARILKHGRVAATLPVGTRG